MAERLGRRRELGVSRNRLSQVLALTFLAPDIQEQVLALEAVDGGEPPVTESGCCGPVKRELVSSNALDGAVDALARFLAIVPRGEVAAAGGTRERLRIFPALHTVPALDEAARLSSTVPHGAAAADRDQRSLAFAALADLLTFAAARRPIVLLLDDVQWADADSLALLADLFAGRAAPPVLLITTTRLAADGAIAARTAVHVPVDVVHLGGLERAEAEALVRAAAPKAASCGVTRLRGNLRRKSFRRRDI